MHIASVVRRQCRKKTNMKLSTTILLILYIICAIIVVFSVESEYMTKRKSKLIILTFSILLALIGILGLMDYLYETDIIIAYIILFYPLLNFINYQTLRYFYIKDTGGREPIFSYMKYYDFSQGGYPRKVTRADRIFSLLLYFSNILEILGIYFLIDSIKN